MTFHRKLNLLLGALYSEYNFWLMFLLLNWQDSGESQGSEEVSSSGDEEEGATPPTSTSRGAGSSHVPSSHHAPPSASQPHGEKRKAPVVEEEEATQLPRRPRTRPNNKEKGKKVKKGRKSPF